jgi:capsule polysaccharide modification protein KpsS
MNNNHNNNKKKSCIIRKITLRKIKIHFYKDFFLKNKEKK